MAITFHVFDKDTGRPLNGELIYCMYQECWSVPIISGRAEVVSTGDFKGAKRRFIVRSEGYVDHSAYFFQYNGLSFEVPLARYYWFEEPVSPSEPEPPSASALLPVIAIGGLALLTR